MLIRPRFTEPGATIRFFAWTIFAVRLAFFDPLELLRARGINDYGSFHAAAYAISEGLDPYNPATLQAAAAAAGLGGAHPYLYPPFLAELLVPLTWLEPFPARVVWGLVSLVCFFGTMLLLDRWILRATCDSQRAPDARAAFALVMCGFWPVRETQWGAQVNAVVLLLLAAWWTLRDRTDKAGIALGVAAAIKMSPALLILIPLSQRRFREAATAGAVLALLVTGSCAVLGAPGLRFLTSVVAGFVPGHAWHNLQVNIDVPGNHSLAALAFWLVDRNGAAEHLRLSPAAATLHIGMAATLLALWVVRARKIPKEASLAALIVVMIVAPTYAFEHHLSFMTIAFAMSLVLVHSGKLRTGWIIAVAVAMSLLLDQYMAFAIPEHVSTRLSALARLPKLAPMLVIYCAALSASGAAPQHAEVQATANAVS